MLVSSILKHVNTILLNTLPKLNWKKKSFYCLKTNNQTNKRIQNYHKKIEHMVAITSKTDT